MSSGIRCSKKWRRSSTRKSEAWILWDAMAEKSFCSFCPTLPERVHSRWQIAYAGKWQKQLFPMTSTSPSVAAQQSIKARNCWISSTKLTRTSMHQNRTEEIESQADGFHPVAQFPSIDFS